jgi:hypothetical protein
MSPRARWIIACGVAAAVPELLACLGGASFEIGTFSILFGIAQGLALPATFARRWRWAALTAVGVWGAFSFAPYVGIIAYFAIAALIAALGPVGFAATGLANIAVAFPVSAAAGGTVVGLLQSLLVVDKRGWVVRSAVGGVLLFPASILVFLAAPSSCGAPEQTILAVFGVVGALLYGLITAGAVSAATP